jgi:spore coat protein U-like protein
MELNNCSEYYLKSWHDHKCLSNFSKHKFALHYHLNLSVNRNALKKQISPNCHMNKSKIDLASVGKTKRNNRLLLTSLNSSLNLTFFKSQTDTSPIDTSSSAQLDHLNSNHPNKLILLKPERYFP